MTMSRFCRRSLSRHPGLPCWAWLSPTLPWRRRPRLSRHAPPMRRSATLSPRTPITWRDWTGIPICGRCIGMRHCACWIRAWYSAWVACYACQCRGSSRAATSRRVCSPVICGRRNGSPLWAFRRNGCRHWWHGTVWHRRPISIRRPGSNLTPSRSRRWSRSSARTRRDSSSSRSARPARNFLPPLLVLEAARPEPVCASVPVWNILAGARRRAPRFMRRLGLEWLFRLASDPRRLFRRYLIDSPAVIALLLKQRLEAAPSRPRASCVRR